MDAEGEAALTRVMTDPAHPFRVAAAERTTTFDRESVLPTGKPLVGAYLPCWPPTAASRSTLGVLGFGWLAPRTLDDAERETLEGFAGLASLAVERARLASTAAERSDWFERLAHTDPLTGLANERTVGRMLELELARAGRQGGEVSLAMFDIDDFRVTNRDGGHAAGDDVLRRVAAVLADSVRLVDTVGRDRRRRVRPGRARLGRRRPSPAACSAGIAALPAVAGKTVSVSAGVARFPVDGGDAESLIAVGEGRAGAGEGRRAGPGRRGDRRRSLEADRDAPGRRPDALGRRPERDRRGTRSRRAGRGLTREGDDDPGAGRDTGALEVPRPGRAHGEAAERDGHVVRADHPRLVDLVAGRRREVLHRDEHLAVGADGGQPGRTGPAVGREDRGQEPSWRARSMTAATCCWYACVADNWPWSSTFQPISTPMTSTAAMRRAVAEFAGKRASTRSAKIFSRQFDRQTSGSTLPPCCRFLPSCESTRAILRVRAEFTQPGFLTLRQLENRS